MRILYVSNSGKFGGMEWHIYDLAKGLKSKGHEVFLWCDDGPIKTKYESLGISVATRKINSDIDFSYIKDLSKFLRENKIDVVHSHELKSVVNTLIAGTLAGTKVKVSITHTPISEWRIGKFKKALDILIYKFFVNKFSDAEIALTNSRKETKIFEGIKEDKLVVIPNSFKTYEFDIPYDLVVSHREEIRKRYNIQKDAFVFGCVGRLTVEKDTSTLIKAFKKFLGTDLFHKNKFYLLIAGGGDLEEDLKNLTAELGISDSVIITGVFNQEDLVKFYSSFDAFVFPSLTEGFGLVLVEAMYMRLPVICSDLPVLREVGGSTVEYFDTGNEIDLSEKMVSVYSSIIEGNYDKTGDARLRVEENFSMDIFINNYVALYTRLMEKKK